MSDDRNGLEVENSSISSKERNESTKQVSIKLNGMLEEANQTWGNARAATIAAYNQALSEGFLPEEAKTLLFSRIKGITKRTIYLYLPSESKDKEMQELARKRGRNCSNESKQPNQVTTKQEGSLKDQSGYNETDGMSPEPSSPALNEIPNSKKVQRQHTDIISKKFQDELLSALENCNDFIYIEFDAEGEILWTTADIESGNVGDTPSSQN